MMEYILIFAVYTVVMLALQLFLLNLKKGKTIKKIFLFLKTYAVFIVTLGLLIYFLLREFLLDFNIYPDPGNIYFVLFLFTFLVVDMVAITLFQKKDAIFKKDGMD